MSPPRRIGLSLFAVLAALFAMLALPLDAVAQAEQADQADQAEQVIEVRLAVWPRALDLGSARVTLTANGRTISRPLTRDAFLENRSSRPGLWKTSFHGPPVRIGEVSVEVEQDGVPVVLWKRLVRFSDPRRSVLNLRAEVARDRLRIVRTFWVAYEGSPDRRISRVALLLAFGWGGLVVLFVGLQVRRARS